MEGNWRGNRRQAKLQQLKMFTLQCSTNLGCAVIFPASSNTSAWNGKAVPFSITILLDSGFILNVRGGPAIRDTILEFP